MNGRRVLPLDLVAPAGKPVPADVQVPRAELWLSPAAEPPSPQELRAIALAVGQLLAPAAAPALAAEELEWRFSGRWWLEPGAR